MGAFSMLSSTEKIIDAGLSQHLIQDVDLANLFGGSPARRYGLVNKALKKQEIIQLRRGLYVVAPKYQPVPWSVYVVANHLVPFSFVTAESALSFHQWIPERVSQVTSLAAFGRKRQVNNTLGRFVYRVAPLSSQDFLKGVELILIHQQTVWMATPLRALIDYIDWRKVNSADSEFLTTSLRIEIDHLNRIKKKEIEALLTVYRSHRVKQFLTYLLEKVGHH